MGTKHPSPDQEDSPTQKRLRTSEEWDREPSASIVEDSSDDEEDLEGAAQRQLLAIDQKEADRHRVPGPPRESGTISKVILVQFMCHPYQVVELGPQINFLIGHNGSGKSAVLTAISIVLGAKASSTNRGNSLKTFIREGQNKAEVTLHLTNRGVEAFRPQIYGDEIIIQRNISKDGSSMIKIKSGRDNKVIGHTRDTLQTILDHFMIQADNPLNVLNQEASKEFLKSSSSRQKYDFFIKGTQLRQLTEEYEIINRNLTLCETQLERKHEDLPELSSRAESAKKNMEQLREASRAQDKITEIEKEIFWIYVAQADRERESALQKLDEEQRVLPKYEAKVEEATDEIALLDGRIKDLEAKKEARNDDTIDTRRLELTRMHRSVAEKITKLNLKADSELRTTDDEISQQIKAINLENSKSLQNTGSSRQQTMERIGQLNDETSDLESQLAQTQQKISGEQEAVKSKNIAKKECEDKLRNMVVDIENNQRAIQEYTSTRKNRLLLFGPAAGKLKQAIESNNSWAEMPIGPLGYHIQIKDKAWQPVVETVLGGLLRSYMVVNKTDEKLLRSLMEQCGCSFPIIRSRRELFDYSGGEPLPEFFTILRALNIEDEYVKRALINDLRIEKSILVEQRREGESIMSQSSSRNRNIALCYTRDGYQVGGLEGGRRLRPLKMHTGQSRISHDDGSFIAGLNKKAAELGSAIEEVKRQASVADSQSRQSNAQLGILKTEERQIKEKLRKAKGLKLQLQDELDQSVSSDVSALEETKRELESGRRTLYDQSQELIRQKEILNAELEPIKAEQDALKLKTANRQDEEDALNIELTQAINEQVNASGKLKYFKVSLNKQSIKVAEAKANYELANATLPEVISAAKRVSESDEIVKSFRSLQEAKADHAAYSKIVLVTQSRHQKSLELTEIEYYQAIASYDNAKKHIEEQMISLKVLTNALVLRKETWKQFRNGIANRAGIQFLRYLDHRTYTGKLSFHHDTQRLNVHVNPCEQQGKLKDPKTLSGGEKSYSTIALLLTLWDAIDCPIRCLDEFDVYMDDVNRRVSLKMMIDSAEKAHDVQYLFITPNGLTAAQVGKTSKIIRMEDPSRSNGTLAAGQE
ncbi:hypothetical protein PSTG_15098 [Puccinia striiformis f. sp. tritici PST-78]|uniref:RecF/RecN/SMC N-terminal domain-containing protein n=1 Tax=Puccinia striiformis f. sp. tritici PST-78 TaxID=1165861 RepID=A0A0L0UWT9_9BASI|nr:hypothetical protein PSTG_15098 [Puccinia striiformis f. sp. tritici PST-78]